MTENAIVSGLLASEAQGGGESVRHVPLTGVRVKARITGPTQRVRISQTYRNTMESPVEAVYVFPLEEGNAVCGMRVLTDGEELVGRVQARDEAFDTYDDAMAEGRMAFLLDEERPDILTASVGNLLPDQEVVVELEYVGEVIREGDALRWRLPTTVSPRYVPPRQLDFEGVEDAERISPPLTMEPLPYRLQLTVDVDLGTPLASVESPSHTIRVELDGGRARVELAGEEGALDRDFVLLLTPREPPAPLVGIEEGPDGRRYAAVSFLPRYETARTPTEIIFVVDCSGSMSGSSMEEARRTLRLCLRSLEPGDRFNIVRFGSHYERYAEESVPYDEATLGRADRWVQRMEADLGGTELVPALAAAYRIPRVAGMRRCLVLITDGEVANEDEAIRLAGRHAGEAPVFAFGIGYGASEYLVRSVARAGRGAAEMVYPGERVEDKVLRHFGRMTASPVENLELSWEGLEVEEPVPAALGPAWAGEPLTVFARIAEGREGTAVLTGAVGGEAIRCTARLAPPEGTPGGIAVLWARGRIRELEEGKVWTDRRGSAQDRRTASKREARRREVEQRLVELGTTFGLVSSATSFVLVDERPDAPRAESRCRLVRVPGGLTRGWGGLGGFGTPVGCAPSAPATGTCFTIFGMRRRRPTAMWKVATTPKEDLNLIAALSIHAEGYWDPSPEVLALTSLSRERVEKLARLVPVPEAVNVVVTLAVVVRVDDGRGRVPVVWRFPLRKARRWLKAQLDGRTPPEGSSWEEWMRRQLAAAPGFSTPEDVGETEV